MIQIKPSVHYGHINFELIKPYIQGENVIVVCSNSVKNKTYITSFFDELNSSDYNFKLYSHMRPNAPFSDIYKIIDDNKQQKPTTIIGIGGGSVVDSCKALSVCFEDASIEDLFYKKVPMPNMAINVIAIPTTAGTGAELSFGAIVYDDVNHVKGGIRGEVIQPKSVFIDVELYRTAPKKLLAEVGFDCLTHAVETYISVKSNPLIRYQSVAAINTIFDCLVAAVNGDSEALRSVSIASALMGINLAYSSTCLPHRIQYVIGPLTDTSHAQGLIALYKGWLQLINDNKEKSGLVNLESELGRLGSLLDNVTKLKEDLNINYSLTTLGVVESQLEMIANNVKGSVQNDPCYQDKSTILQILKNSL